MRRWVELVILALWVVIGVAVYLRYTGYMSHTDLPPDQVVIPTVPISESGRRYEVRRITVLRGDTFDITLSNESRILAKLSVVAVEEAKKKVLDLLNHGSGPKVVLREKQPDGRWLVDLYVTYGGTEVNLTEWLGSNKLVYK